ncbi:MAG TPA: hypothetical protein VFX59_20730, partial [Polyangiales bacterium]|nr:hypothetical protein [Polyangiales bacterium]
MIAVLVPASALAQRRTTIGFEADCAGTQLAGSVLIGNSFVDKPASLYAPCGVSSIETGETSGFQRIVVSGGLLGDTIGGISGMNALAGAYNNLQPSEIRIGFAAPVHELSFDVLGAGMQIRVRTFNGDAQVSDDSLPASSGRSPFARASSSEVTRVVVSVAQPSGAFGSVDRWYLDQLSFNSWVCGDGELEDQNGGSEACDDG